MAFQVPDCPDIAECSLVQTGAFGFELESLDLGFGRRVLGPFIGFIGFRV